MRYYLSDPEYEEIGIFRTLEAARAAAEEHHGAPLNWTEYAAPRRWEGAARKATYGISEVTNKWAGEPDGGSTEAT